MAKGRSQAGAYWLGVLAGLVCLAALATAMTLVETRQARKAEAEAPEPASAAPTTADAGAATQKAEAPAASEAEAAAPEPQAEAPANAEPTAETTPGAAQTRAPQPQVATPAPEIRMKPDPVEPAPSASPGAPASEEPTTGTAAAPAASEPEPSAPATEPEAETAAAPAPETPLAAPGLAANRVAFDGDASRPLLAVVITGVGPEEASRLATLGAPVAAVLKPGAPASLAQTLRDGGIEVLTTAAPAKAEGAVIGVAALAAEANGAAMPDGTTLREAEARDLAFLDLAGEGESARRAGGGLSAVGGRRIDIAPSSDLVYQSLDRAAAEAKRAGAFIAYGEAGEATRAGLRRWIAIRNHVAADLAPLSAAMEKLEGE